MAGRQRGREARRTQDGPAAGGCYAAACAVNTHRCVLTDRRPPAVPSPTPPLRRAAGAGVSRLQFIPTFFWVDTGPARWVVERREQIGQRVADRHGPGPPDRPDRPRRPGRPQHAQPPAGFRPHLQDSRLSEHILVRDKVELWQRWGGSSGGGRPGGSARCPYPLTITHLLVHHFLSSTAATTASMPPLSSTGATTAPTATPPLKRRPTASELRCSPACRWAATAVAATAAAVPNSLPFPAGYFLLSHSSCPALCPLQAAVDKGFDLAVNLHVDDATDGAHACSPPKRNKLNIKMHINTHTHTHEAAAIPPTSPVLWNKALFRRRPCCRHPCRPNKGAHTAALRLGRPPSHTIAGGLGGWRNTLDFDPLQSYGGMRQVRACVCVFVCLCVFGGGS